MAKTLEDLRSEGAFYFPACTDEYALDWCHEKADELRAEGCRSVHVRKTVTELAPDPDTGRLVNRSFGRIYVLVDAQGEKIMREEAA
jgi:hypothetical protein